jgi:hypothetical protein
VKTLLNITVFASAVLSLFSTSLTLYEVPVLKESMLALEKEYVVQDSSSASDMKKVYISHDVSNKGRDKFTPLLAANDSGNFSTSTEDYIKVFGVKVPNKNARSNI